MEVLFREIYSRPDDHACLALAKSWLSDCFRNHLDTRCSINWGRFTPPRLLDLGLSKWPCVIRLVETCDLFQSTQHFSDWPIRPPIPPIKVHFWVEYRLWPMISGNIPIHHFDDFINAAVGDHKIDRISIQISSRFVSCFR